MSPFKSLNQEKKSLLVLLLINIYWGITTVYMKNVLKYMSPQAYMVLRFGAGSLFLLLVFHKKVPHFSKQIIKKGLVLGTLLFIPMILTVIGLKYTSTSNSVFISQLSFIVVPAIVFIHYKIKAPIYFYISMIALTTGILVFSNAFGSGLNFGDGITFISMFVNSINILVIDKISKEEDPILLGIAQMVFATVLSLVFGLKDIPSVIWNFESIYIIILTGMIGSGVAFTLRISTQKHLNAITVALVSLTSPIFGLIGAIAIPDSSGNTESLTFGKVLGSIIIIGAISYYLLMEKKEQRS